MLNIYVKEKDISKNNFIEFNDDQFYLDLEKGLHNKHLDIIKKIVKRIDNSTVINNTSAKNENDEIFDITKISTGAKTVINTFIHPESIVSTIECGNNALLAIFEFITNGNIYLPYLPSFEKDIIFNGKIIVGNKSANINKLSDIYNERDKIYG